MTENEAYEAERAERAIEASGADITSIVRGYLAAQLWTAIQYDEDGSDPVELDELYDVDDFSAEYVAHVAENVRGFVAQHPLAVRMYGAQRTGEDGNTYRVRPIAEFDWGYFGHDYLLTRDGHGAGFWDRGLGELGEYLTKWAQCEGESAHLWSENDVLRADF